MLMGRRQENAVVSTLDSVLRERGFSRHKKVWYLHKPDTKLVVDLQKSPWGLNYCLSFGVLVRQLSAVQKPKLIECHIWDRLEGLMEASKDKGVGQSGPAESPKPGTFAHQILTNPLASITLRLDDPAFFDTTGLKPAAIGKALD